jgi:hypothetical protein
MEPLLIPTTTIFFLPAFRPQTTSRRRTGKRLKSMLNGMSFQGFGNLEFPKQQLSTLWRENCRESRPWVMQLSLEPLAHQEKGGGEDCCENAELEHRLTDAAIGRACWLGRARPPRRRRTPGSASLSANRERGRVSFFMHPDKVKLLYDGTIGRVVGANPNPLWHLGITCGGASGVADIDLGLDVAVARDRATQDSIRGAARKYLQSCFEGGEGMRCWLGVSGNPRINVWLKRRPGIIGIEFENAEAIARIQHWCRQAGLRLH